MSVLKLNPNMATYEKITRKGIRSDIEEAFAKLRYSRLYEAEEETETGEEIEVTPEEKEKFDMLEAMQDHIYCPERKVVDMTNR